MRWATALLLALWAALAAAPAPAVAPDAGCRACHQGMTPPMPPGDPHALACTVCHGGRGQAQGIEAGHEGLTANPSALDRAEVACGPCHPGWPERVRRSPMATAAGVINQTRRLWDAQQGTQPLYGVRAEGALGALPSPDRSGRPVDDFLRRRCLRCHLWTPGADAAGARRSAGCAACHRPTDDTGGRPTGHRLTKRVPVSQCQRCHADCGAGSQYGGRAPRDATLSARFLAADPERTELWQARAWRPMRPDLHFAAGLACIDCHTRGEIMGDGLLRPAGLLHVGVRCFSCHGRPGQPPPAQPRTGLGEPLAGLSWGEGALWLTGKLDGRRRRVPLPAGGAGAPAAHLAPGHQRLACHACHNAANPAAWGLQVLLETRPAYELWRPIMAQGDPQVLALWQAQLALPPERRRAPVTRDLLSGELRPGAWLASPFFRRFEWRVYGQGPDGRLMLLSPRFQYVVTRLDRDDQVAESAVVRGLGMTPWHSHATRRATVACADCHGGGAAMAMGLGQTFLREGGRLAPELWRPELEGLALQGGWTRVVDRQGRARQVFLVPGARPLEPEVLERLLSPGKEYTRWLLRALEEEWPPANDATGPGR